MEEEGVEEEETVEEVVEEQEEELVIPEFVLTSKTKGIVRMGASANISMAVLRRIPREAMPKAHPVYELAVQVGMCKTAIASSNSSRIHIKVIWLM